MRLSPALFGATWLVAMLTGASLVLGYSECIASVSDFALVLVITSLVIAANVGLVHAAYRAGRKDQP